MHIASDCSEYAKHELTHDADQHTAQPFGPSVPHQLYEPMPQARLATKCVLPQQTSCMTPGQAGPQYSELKKSALLSAQLVEPHASVV